MADFPWRCRACGAVQMVDLEGLQERKAEGTLISCLGFQCQNCGHFVEVFFTERSLEETLQKMKRYNPGHPKFAFMFQKAVRKAVSVHLRAEAYGSLKR